MAIDPFTRSDFAVFAIPGFADRMAAIRSRLRPKLDALGGALAPPLARAVGEEVFAHVARHARRTVNPPDDTWVAFGPDRRGYKKAPHFKVALSRHCLRLLFEIGPEHAAKPAWSKAWKRAAPHLAKGLGAVEAMGWFKNEHDEVPAAWLRDLGATDWQRLGEDLVRTRDGQLVLGRRIEATAAARWSAGACEKAALETFSAFADCFRLR